MRLSTPLFNALVRALAPLLRERAERDRLLGLAFHGEPALYDGLSPEADSPQQYAAKLVRSLESARTGDGQWALLVYVETVRDDVGGDRAATLAGYLAQLQAYEAARATLRQAGLDPTTAHAGARLILLCRNPLRLARAAFPKGNISLTMRGEFGVFSEDELFAAPGQPVESPWRLALVCVIQ